MDFVQYSWRRDQLLRAVLLKTIAGVKIAVIGVTTPLIPDWEAEEHYHGYRFESGVEAVRRTVAEVRARQHPDIIIVAAHAAGLDGRRRENMVRQIATEVPGIDAIVFGHTHQQLASLQIGSCFADAAEELGDFARAHGFRVAVRRVRRMEDRVQIQPLDSGHSRDRRRSEDPRDRAALSPSSPRVISTRPSPKPPFRSIRAWHAWKTPPSSTPSSRCELYYSKADVSFASSFNARVSVPKGPVTIRQIAALYIYENQLYAIEGNGKMVRDALENSARYFRTCAADCSHGPLINPDVIGYNYDMAQGVDYEIDLTQPPGHRIRNLRWHGKPLDNDQPLRIAVNNYRAGGSAGYSMFRGAKITWRSPDEIRDLVIQYYREHKTLPAQPDNNWRVVPETALHTLEHEALASEPRPF